MLSSIVARRRAGGGPTPALQAIGATTSASGTNTRSPAYPVGIQAGDIIFLHIHLNDALGNASISSVTGGWNTAVDVPYVNDDTARLLWKRATGSESGTETVTLSESVDTGIIACKMFVARGCLAVGTPFEGETTNSQTATTSHVGSSVVTTGPNRRVITVYGCSNANTTGTETNGWTEDWEDGIAAGNTGVISGSHVDAPSATTVSANTRTMAFSVRNVSFSLALLPA